MSAHLLHADDFIEMLERGDSLESIAGYGRIKTASVERRFERLPREIRERIQGKRKSVRRGVYA